MNYQMKSFKNFVLLAVIGLSFSCGSKEDESPVDSKMLIGDWDFESYEYSVTSKMTFDGDIFESKSVGTATESDAKVSFNESPNTYTGGGYYVVSLKTETNGTSYEEEIKIDNFFQNGTWVVN